MSDSYDVRSVRFADAYILSLFVEYVIFTETSFFCIKRIDTDSD